MPRTLSLFTNGLDDDQRGQLDRALRQFHIAQEALRLESRGECELVLEGDRINVWRFLKAPGRQGQIVVTGRRLSDNWFSRSGPDRAIVTVADWNVAFFSDRSEAPKNAPDAGILVSLALTTTVVLAGCDDIDLLHDESVGCLFDLCAHKPDRALKMRAAYICSRCTSTLASRGVSSVDLDAIQAVLEQVRLLVLGRRPQATVPSPDGDTDAEFLASASLPPDVVLPPRLIAACTEHRLTVLVGSGMSLQDDVSVEYPHQVPWRALPTWSDVPARMSEAVRRYTGRVAVPRDTQNLDEFLADLDYFRRALGESVYYPRAIFDIFSPHILSPGRANRMLFRLPHRWILTTNYDFVLQYAAPAGTPVFTWREARQAREYLTAGRARNPLLKVHGCASRPDTVILTSLEYERLRQDDEYLSLLRHVFESQTILFVGFGLNDPYDLDLALRQARLAGAAEGEKFALLPQERARQVREMFPQIQTIAYSDHASVAAILAVLARGAS